MLFPCHFMYISLVDMGITPHTPTQNRTCPTKAYGFSPYIHTTCKMVICQVSTLLQLVLM